MKRMFDVVSALLLLMMSIPLMLAAVVIITLKIGRPVIFKQERIGYKESTFTIYKFKTMSDKRDDTGQLLSDSERQTKAGNILRKYSIDELPQLVNVLKGDMSMVGPRPLLVEYLPLYSIRQRKRHNVKPGITGWAQVNGRNDLTWPEKFELDVWYVENQSFLVDMKILCMTFYKVVKNDGVTAKDGNMMAYFTGN
jgi:sugar transferase EpsL